VETLILLFLLGFIFLILAGWLASIEWRYHNLQRTFQVLMTGPRGADLEAMLLDNIARMNRVEEIAKGMEERESWFQATLPNMVQHIGVIRFNPFPDKGGDQSFVVAMLNDHADGVVLTGLHSRADSRVYAKPVVAGQSSYTLTGEEKEAITRAMGARVTAPPPVPPP
jgi:hypothetical protein